MKTTATMLPDRRARLDIEVPADRVEHDMEHTLGHLSESVRIPGFRKGKVPARVVLQRLGREEVLEETLREFLGRWTAEAVSTTGLHAIDRPEVDYDALPGEGEAFVYRATVQLRPQGTLPEPLELEAPRLEGAIPEEAVEEELARLRVESSPLTSVERPAARGDLVELSFSADVAGKPVPGMAADGMLVELGAGRLLDEIEREVLGMRGGETAELTVDLPADYSDRKLAGKPARVSVTVGDVRERDLRAFDDELARAASEFDTLAELRESITASFQAELDREIDGRYRAAVAEALGNVVQVDLPQAMVLERVDDLLLSLARGIERRGVPFGTWLERSGRTLDQVRGELIPDAVASIRQELGLEALAEREGIEVDDDRLRELLLEEAAGEEDPAGAVEEVMASEAKERMREELRLRLAVDRAVELSTPITPEQAEARAKLWTPDKEAAEDAPKPQLWTPGS